VSRVLVLGGTGFVGRHLVARLAARGHEPVVATRAAAPAASATPGTRVRALDPYDQAALASALQGVDAVVNLVGILNERGFDGHGFRRAHVELTRTLVAACADAGVRRLVQMSALNAGRGDSHYLRTRGEAESIVRASGLDWTIVRPSVIFGPGDGLFTRFAGLLKLSPVLPLARATARFAPVYVGDVAEAIVRALERPEAVGATCELGGPRVMTLREIVDYTAAQLGITRWSMPLPDALGWLQGQVFDLVPGKPFSSDNFRSLALDSVPGTDGLAALGIAPTPVEAIVPEQLRRPR
jgi:uncharacterized protein YbjT (DUF2867 family)